MRVPGEIHEIMPLLLGLFVFNADIVSLFDRPEEFPHHALVKGCILIRFQLDETFVERERVGQVHICI